jgi:GNAT superfamily N-acetyltransferase
MCFDFPGKTFLRQSLRYEKPALLWVCRCQYRNAIRFKDELRYYPFCLPVCFLFPPTPRSSIKQPVIQIRPCCAGDFDQVILLLLQLWPDRTVNPAALHPVFHRALTSDLKTYLCAVDKGQVVGFGSLTVQDTLLPERNLGHIDELVVDGKYRNKGIGKQLLEQLVSMAKHKGCRQVELNSAFHRKEAHRFYERNGFEGRAFVFLKYL